MISKIRSTLNWLPYYFGRELSRSVRGERIPPKQIHFCICDHFEPYCQRADKTTARKRIQRWLDEYPKIADRYRDSDGNVLKYTFFYPEEEYQEDDLNVLAELCYAGYGEVQIHLHHDNDTSENLRRTLIDYKKRLHEKHGLLSIDESTGEIVYAFIHGNWALCDSRPDGRWCGVKDEINILLETGCYADFSMPSAPNETQTRKVNSIYYAVNKVGETKSHDWGVDAQIGKSREGLLMVQGPLGFNWSTRKFGILPGIENGGLYGSNPPTKERVKLWIDAGICVQGAPEHVFVKIYTHGAQEDVMRMLFDEGNIDKLLNSLVECNVSIKFNSAKEMAASIIKVINTVKTDTKAKMDSCADV